MLDRRVFSLTTQAQESRTPRGFRNKAWGCPIPIGLPQVECDVRFNSEGVAQDHLETLGWIAKRLFEAPGYLRNSVGVVRVSNVHLG